MNAVSRLVKRFLTGDFSQGQAFWAILVPALLLLKFSISMLSLSNLIENPVLSTRLWLPVIAVVFVLILPVLFFATAKSIYIASKTFKGGYQSLMLAGALAFVGYLTVAEIVGHWSTAKTMVSIAAKHDAYNVVAQISEDRNSIDISGQLTYDSAKLVKKQLSENPNITTIKLDVDAGHLHEARMLARLIYTQSLNTHVEGQCLGSCMLVLVAGKERTAADSARLGFHRTLDYDNGYRSEWLMERERRRDQHYYGLRGVAPSYIYPIYYKQKDDAYFEPSKAELLNYGVLTGVKS